MRQITTTFVFNAFFPRSCKVYKTISYNSQRDNITNIANKSLFNIHLIENTT